MFVKWELTVLMTDLAPVIWLYIFVVENIKQKKKQKKTFLLLPSAFIFLPKYCLSTIPINISYLAIYSTERQKNVIQVLPKCITMWSLHDAQ